MSDLKIALLRNNGTTASVGYGDLPNFNESRPTITLSAFKNIAAFPGHALRYKVASTPVYANDTIYWAVHGEKKSGNGSDISVWRIGRHFVLTGADRAVDDHPASGTVTGSPWGRPGVVVNGKIVTVSYFGTDGNMHTVQKKTDGTWTDVLTYVEQRPPVNRWSGPMEDADSMMMFNGSSFADKIIYTYRIIADRFSSRPFKIDMMETNNLTNAYNDKSLGWNKSIGNTYLSGTDPAPAHVITHADDGQSHKLWFFTRSTDNGSILCRWIDLKDDGLINPEKNHKTVDGNDSSGIAQYQLDLNTLKLETSRGSLSGSGPPWSGYGRQVTAYTWTVDNDTKQEQILLLLWQTNDCFTGIGGTLDEYGGIPKDWRWKPIQVISSGSLPRWDSYDTQGVLVPGWFC